MSKKWRKTRSRKSSSAKKKPTTTWGKIWHFIWYEDSLLSWVANIVLAFFIIKFLVYPLLSVVFGTSLPVVAVISCSMDHGFADCGTNLPNNLCGVVGEGSRDFDSYWNTCGSYYEDRGITKEAFAEYPLRNGFRKGDVIVLKGVEPENAQVGDVLVFMSGRAYPIIHRIIDINQDDEGYTFQTKGDHNPTQIVDSGLNETAVRSDHILGVGFLRIPYIGYVKILAVDAISFMLGK